MTRTVLFAALASVSLAACATTPAPRTENAPSMVEVQILAINDFHGNLETPQSPTRYLDNGTEQSARLGGASALAATLQLLRRENTVTVAAGDLIGASPLVSSLFLDEPSISALSTMGLDIAAVGNHEFDRGIAELRRIQNGGCEQHTRREPCAVEPFMGAGFRYLAANVVDENTTTLFPGTELRRFGDVVIGFVGMTLEGTPSLVAAQATEGYAFLDEASTANAAARALLADGADTVVLLIHEGGDVDPRFNIEGCPGLSGPIVPIIEALDPAISVVVSGHTHQAYVCNVATSQGSEVLLTSGGRYGGFVTDITMMIDPAANRVTALEARNVPVDGSAGEDAGVAAHVARYAEAAGPVANRAVGSITDSGERGEDCGDRPADGLIADAYQAQASAAMDAPVDLALVNSGGVRTDLSGAADGVLTFGELAAMAPFGNSVLVLEMTGAEISAVLEQQFCAENGAIGVCDSIIVPSASLAYRVDLTRPLGQNVVDLMLNGEPIDPAATYRLATNNFLAGGGDGFTLFTQASTIANTGFDIDGLEAYVARGDLSVPVCGRVRGIAPVD